MSRTTYTGGGAYQSYTYDAAGRLTRADDTQAGVTTHRGYGFDANTNRTSLVTTVDDVDGGAPTTKAVNSTYDTADRLIATGTVYDAFGRTTAQSSGAQKLLLRQRSRPPDHGGLRAHHLGPRLGRQARLVHDREQG
ncbi:hypothetical protein [Streptomyces clavifer]|uniref:hypothetical protein n=1 Tax=Streptomyces clavifer TaxID=68188 RepID=UPI00369FA226